MLELAEGEIDLARFIRKGDRVMWGHGTSEPQVLTRALVEQRACLGAISAFIGLSLSPTLRPEHGDFIRFTSYCGIGANHALHDAGVLDIIPCNLSQLPGLIGAGSLRADVVFMQLAPGPDGGLSPGVSHDYLVDAARHARVVIAEVNDRLPRTHGADELQHLRIHAVVRTSYGPIAMASRAPSEVEQRVARHAAALVPDRAVLQAGIGTLPEAVLRELRDRRDLGLHSGMAGDAWAELVQAGVITNAHKAIDRGISITGMLGGTAAVYGFADRNPGLRLAPVSYTHSARVLASIDGLHAINSALEVDLTGQANAEVLGNQYVGAIGGQVDFIRGAALSRGGRSILALPSTASSGASRIVARLSGPVTTARSDADAIVTEWGVAELAGQPLAERMRRMTAIAHPDHREALERAAFDRRHA